MTDSIAERNAVLDQMVALRTRYCELRRLQSERLDAITLGSVPDGVSLGVERVVMVEEQSVVDEFLRLAEAFPPHEGSDGHTVTAIQPRAGWFGLRRGQEVLVEAEAPELSEARLQDARLAHLLEGLAEDLSERRAALQHASYTIKRVVVGLNQSAEISIDEGGVRKIDRDRHGLETLVSLIERTIQDIVVDARRNDEVMDRRPKPAIGAPETSQTLLLAG